MLQVSYLGIDSPVPTAKATEASESVVVISFTWASKLLVMSISIKASWLRTIAAFAADSTRVATSWCESIASLAISLAQTSRTRRCDHFLWTFFNFTFLSIQRAVSLECWWRRHISVYIVCHLSLYLVNCLILHRLDCLLVSVFVALCFYCELNVI